MQNARKTMRRKNYAVPSNMLRSDALAPKMNLLGFSVIMLKCRRRERRTTV